ncbi:hypothetical protein D3C83_252360 [compost metagenome]
MRRIAVRTPPPIAAARLTGNLFVSSAGSGLVDRREGSGADGNGPESAAACIFIGSIGFPTPPV